MCLLLKEKSPSNKDEIGFFPCIAVHAAPLLSWTVSGHSQERGDGSIRFVCSGKAASQGMLGVQGQAQRLKDKLSSLYTLCHPWPQQHWCPLGSWTPAVVGNIAGNIARQLRPCCPFPPAGMPSAVTVCPHGIACARLSSSLWSWKVSQQPGVLQCRGPSHPALPWERTSMVGAGWEEWFPVQRTGGSILSSTG